jgi:hypothetical protein
MDYALRMSDFAAKCGLPPPETAAGAVVIDFDGIPVSFLDDAPGRAIVLHAAIGEAPAEAGGDLARRMLEANAALREKPGAVLCQDPETKAFGAIRTIPLQLAEPDFLAEAVGDLVKTAAEWRERLDRL